MRSYPLRFINIVFVFRRYWKCWPIIWPLNCSINWSVSSWNLILLFLFSKIMYNNYIIVLKLLLKSVKILYSLFRAQSPPLRRVSQYGNRFPLNLFNNGQPITSILMSWRLPKNKNRFFSTPLQLICFRLIIVLRYEIRVCGKLFLRHSNKFCDVYCLTKFQSFHMLCLAKLNHMMVLLKTIIQV